MAEQHLLIVDASGFAFRSYYAFPPYYRASDGQPTGAVLGFMTMLWKMLGAAEADKPTHAVAVFDAPGKNFRHELFPAYKANRDPARAEELRDQMPFMRHVAETLGLHAMECPGFEADDVIATLAKNTPPNMRTTIVSSDKDFCQLVRDNVIEIVDPMSKKRVLEKDVEAKFGVSPPEVPAVQALWGDVADGIPGVRGCGRDKAARLVRSFIGLEHMLANVEKVRFHDIRAELKKRGMKEKVLLYQKLATLRTDVPVDLDYDKLKATPAVRSHLMRMCKVLEAPKQFEVIFGLSKNERIVPHDDDPLAWHREELIAPGQTITDEPQCGTYKRRLAKGTPFVPARIWRSPGPNGVDVLRCEVGGQARDPFEQWPALSMNPITVELYAFMMADAKHAKQFRPDDPKARPGQRIDPTKHAAVQNPRRTRT